MVFGLFTRSLKSTLDTSASPEDDQNTRLPTPTPSVASVIHHSPFRFPTALRSALRGSTTDLTLKDSGLTTDSVAGGGNNDHSPGPPPVTPSPPPIADPNEARILYDLVATIPPKTLHAYTLAHLRPLPPLPSTSMSSPALGSHPDIILRPPSPNTVTKLATFFSTLAPPPALHCMRCHKHFYDIENEEKDKACRIPHDDESALVSRISGGGYETLWGCCGQIASGDGSEGPPDGWCYEGRHTTDVKRARFRADSSMHDDKLTSCLKLRCHGTSDQLPHHDYHALPFRDVGTSSARKSNPSPVPSPASVSIPRSARKRPRKSLKGASGSENEADAESLASRVAKDNDKEKFGGNAGQRDMAVDEPNPSLKPRIKAKSQPISRARPPHSAASHPISGPHLTPVVSAKAKTTPVKPTSRTLLTQSHNRLPSDSEASTHSRPRTRSRVREESRVRDVPRGRTASKPKLTRADLSERAGRARRANKLFSRSPASEEEPEAETYQESDQEERGRDRKKRRVGRG